MWLYIKFNNVWLYNSLIAYHIFNVRVSIEITNLEHICMEGFVDHSFCILMVFAMSEKNINLAQGSHADDLTNGIDSLIDKRNKQLNRQKE